MLTCALRRGEMRAVCTGLAGCWGRGEGGRGRLSRGSLPISRLLHDTFPRRKETKKRGAVGGAGSDEGEQGGVQQGAGGDAALEAAAAAALSSPSPSLPPASLKLMLLNNTTCRHVMEEKVSAVPSAVGEGQLCIHITTTTTTITIALSTQHRHLHHCHSAFRCPPPTRRRCCGRRCPRCHH